MKRALNIALITVLISTHVLSQVSYALPTGIEVEQGTADVVVDGSTMTINAGDNTIINYSGFDIGEGESVIINLPDADAQILNNVLGGSATQIMGDVNCNGIFILVNTSGIYIGATAKIDAASAVFSTRGITNEDFTNRNYIFKKLTEEEEEALIINKGTINIQENGFGAFIAGAIRNEGVIIAPVGTVALASGNAVTIDVSGRGLISIAIDEAVADTIYDYEGNPITDAISNTGEIRTKGGVVILKADSVNEVFRCAVNLGGEIVADSFNEVDGVISIVSTGGDVDLTGLLQADGGTIDVHADEGSVYNTGTIKADVFNETGYTFRTTGFIDTGLTLMDNLDGAAYYSGALGGGTYNDVGDIIIDGDLSLSGNVYFTAGGVFTMVDDADITGSGILGIRSNATHLSDDVRVSDYSNINGINGTFSVLYLDSNATDPTYLLNNDISAGGTIRLYADTVLNDDITITADAGNSGTGIFENTAEIDCGGNDLTIYSSSTCVLAGETDSALGSIINGGILTLDSAGSDPTYVSSPDTDTLSVSDFRIAGGSFSRTTGAGTVDDPYLIYDIYGLQGLASHNTIGNIYYKLANNIDASGTVNWNAGAGFDPIGAQDGGIAFGGYFNGNNKVIDGLYINRPDEDYVGLFGFASGTSYIYDVGLTNIDITGDDYVGGLAGWNNSILIDNVYTEGVITGSDINDDGGGYYGGLIGYSSATIVDSTISDSYSSVDITSTRGNAGGLIGYVDPSMGGGQYSRTIERSYATGDIDVGGSDYVGGLVGRIVVSGDDHVYLQNTYATGTVTGDGKLGGLVGNMSASDTGWATIALSYAAGDVVSSGGASGGLVGEASRADITSTVGILFSFATGSTTVGGSTGGLVGNVSSPNGEIGVIESYFVDDNHGDQTGKGTAETLANLTNPDHAVYDNWDFTVDGSAAGSGDWIMAGLPHLQNEWSATITDVVGLQMMSLDLDADYTMANNIDASATSAWNYNGATYDGFRPVGDATNGAFTGTFDGGSNTISDLYVNDDDPVYVGLFGQTSGATLSDISILDAYINRANKGDHGYGGILAGYTWNTDISNVTTSGEVIVRASLADKVAMAGGVVGWARYASDGSISNVNSSANVTARTQQYKSYAGGLLGVLNANGGIAEVTESYATGDVEVLQGSLNDIGYAGGFIGYASASGTATISESYSSGTVTSNAQVENYIGGFIGFATAGGVNNFTINDNFSYSDTHFTLTGTSADNSMGGFIGEIFLATNLTLENNYSTGYQSAAHTNNGADQYGGFIGNFHTTAPTLSNNYWNTDTSGGTNGVDGGNVAGITGITTSDMTDWDTFSGDWDTNVWGLVDGETLPYLKWKYSSTPHGISGYVYTSDGGADLGSGVDIRLAVNGTVKDTVKTYDDGWYYVLLDDTDLDANDVLLTYINDDATYDATTVTVADDAGINDLHLYGDDTITLRHETGEDISNTDLAAGIGSINDNDILYTSSGNDITASNANFDLAAGYTYDMDGDLTLGGSVKTMDIDGTFNQGDDTTLTVGTAGPFTVDMAAGVFNKGGGTAKFVTCGIASLSVNNNDLGDVYIESTTGTTVAGDLTVDNIYVNDPNYLLALGTGSTGTITVNEGGTISNSGQILVYGDAEIQSSSPDAAGRVSITGNDMDLEGVGGLTLKNVYVNTTNGLALDAGETVRLGDSNNKFSEVNIASGAQLDATNNGAGNYDMEVAGDWTNSGTGTFNPGTGTVTFAGSGISSITGNNVFHNLTSVTPGKTLVFESGSIQTVNGALTLRGIQGNSIALRSSTPGANWRLNARGTVNVDHLDVSDSVSDGKSIYSPTSHFTRCSGWALAPPVELPGMEDIDRIIREIMIRHGFSMDDIDINMLRRWMMGRGMFLNFADSNIDNYDYQDMQDIVRAKITYDADKPVINLGK